ncbi:amidohydrolase family protein [Streptomyces luomodiensis]|uniref:Amidohydrolase family protein n=1 Tax=Streptomyces luomodiensis TaxID=3026192 RepID=A0ABY9VEK6_9ACTN|nr:amidohydrolase family protein [Streptomyces sp. SCA4-21]WNF01141.1 amidohydrolase family protein [Streptomyces sp. SCA4-21]
MIIDAHAHLVAPDSLYAFRALLLADGGYHGIDPKISDDALTEAAAGNVAIMDSVGTDLQLLSPRPFHLGSSMQPSRMLAPWVRANNDTIARTVALHPTRFAGVGALPLSPDEPVLVGFDELERIDELGFAGVLINPDLHEGRGNTPALGDRYWYPLYEKLVERDLPIHIHSAGCYSGRETYSEHFVTEESIAILSLLRSDVFTHFPTLRIMISHGGGSVPYQIGRWQSEALHPSLGGSPDAERFETALRRFWFDSVLHHPLSLELLLRTVGADRVLFGTEKPGSGSALNPDTGRDFDDIKPVIEGLAFLSEAEKQAVFEDNARTVFPKLKNHEAR